MRLSPDEMIFWQHGFVKLNATIVFTWALMLVLAVGYSLRILCINSCIYHLPIYFYDLYLFWNFLIRFLFLTI